MQKIIKAIINWNPKVKKTVRGPKTIGRTTLKGTYYYNKWKLRTENREK